MPTSKVIETTVGRVIFSEIWPEEMGFPNKVVGKSQLGDLIWNCYKICGHEKTVIMLDQLERTRLPRSDPRRRFHRHR